MRAVLIATAAVLATALFATAQEIPKPGATTAPIVLRMVRASYTPEAKASGIEGTVRVEVTVLTDGTVGEDVTVIQSLDTEFGLDDEAVRASKGWLFKPASRDGKPVTARIVIEQTFSLPKQAWFANDTTPFSL